MADDAGDLPDLPAGTAHCRLDEVVSYRARELAPDRVRSFEQHLQSCAVCRRLVRDAATVLKGVDVTLRGAGSKTSQVDLILARLRRTAEERWTRPRAWTPRQPSQRFWLPAAGVLGVVVLVAMLQLLLVLLPRYWHAKPAVPSPPASVAAAPP